MEVARHKGAQEAPGRCVRQVVEAGFAEQLAEYVRNEFAQLSTQKDGFTCFPANLEEVLDKQDVGDAAELAVLERMRETVSIQGLSVTRWKELRWEKGSQQWLDSKRG